jgi:hypothetical protein
MLINAIQGGAILSGQGHPMVRLATFIDETIFFVQSYKQGGRTKSSDANL